METQHSPPANSDSRSALKTESAIQDGASSTKIAKSTTGAHRALDEVVNPRAAVLKMATVWEILEECDKRIKHCRCFTANASTIRDVIHDALKQMISGEFRSMNKVVDLVGVISTINMHLVQYPRAPDWAPYTYPDLDNIESQMGVIPGFEILHRHGDTASLGQWIINDAVKTGKIHLIFRHDALLHEMAMTMICYMEEIKSLRTRWERVSGRAASLQKYLISQNITSEEIQTFLQNPHRRRSGRLAKIDDAIVAEVDRVVGTYMKLDKLLERVDNSSKKYLKRLESYEISNFLMELKRGILENELESGRRRVQSDSNTSVPILDNKRINANYLAPTDISWDISSEVSLRHKTSRRFEQFPHHDYWFDICVDYMKSERDYLQEKAAEVLDHMKTKISEVKDLEHRLCNINKADGRLIRARKAVLENPNNAQSIQTLENLEAELEELNQEYIAEHERTPIIAEWQATVATLYFDLTLIIRLISLRLDPITTVYDHLSGELCRDIAEMTIARVDNVLETFELLRQLPQQERNHHLNQHKAAMDRFRPSRWSSRLSDAELSQPQTWQGLQTKADIQQRISANLLRDVKASIRAGDYDHNTQRLNNFLSPRYSTRRLLFEPEMDTLPSPPARVEPAGPRVAPTAGRKWAFNKLYDFFVSPDIGPRFDSSAETIPYSDHAPRPWFEPQDAFLRKTDTLVKTPFSAMEMEEFLHTCHKRRILFSYSCRLKVVSQVDKGWGAINISAIDGTPRTQVLPVPHVQWDALISRFRSRKMELVDSHRDRNITVEELRLLANNLSINHRAMSTDYFTEFCEYCNARAVLFLMRRPGHLVRIENGWSNQGVAEDALSLRDFEERLWDYRFELGIVAEDDTVQEDFRKNVELLRHRWNRAGDVVNMPQAREGPMSRELFRRYLVELHCQQRWIALQQDGVTLISEQWL